MVLREVVGKRLADDAELVALGVADALDQLERDLVPLPARAGSTRLGLRPVPSPRGRCRRRARRRRPSRRRRGCRSRRASRPATHARRDVDLLGQRRRERERGALRVAEQRAQDEVTFVGRDRRALVVAGADLHVRRHVGPHPRRVALDVRDDDGLERLLEEVRAEVALVQELRDGPAVLVPGDVVLDAARHASARGAHRERHREHPEQLDRVDVELVALAVETHAELVVDVRVVVAAADRHPGRPLHRLDHARDVGDPGAEALDEAGHEGAGHVARHRVRLEQARELDQLLRILVVVRVHPGDVRACELGLPRLGVADERPVAEPVQELPEQRARERHAGDQLVRDLRPERPPLELHRRLGQRGGDRLEHRRDLVEARLDRPDEVGRHRRQRCAVQAPARRAELDPEAAEARRAAAKLGRVDDDSRHDAPAAAAAACRRSSSSSRSLASIRRATSSAAASTRLATPRSSARRRAHARGERAHALAELVRRRPLEGHAAGRRGHLGLESFEPRGRAAAAGPRTRGSRPGRRRQAECRSRRGFSRSGCGYVPACVSASWRRCTSCDAC